MSDKVIIRKNPATPENASPVVLYITKLGRFYARFHLDITLLEGEYIPSPPPQDIDDTAVNGTGGLINIKLRLMNDQTDTNIVLRHGTILAEIMKEYAKPAGTVLQPADITSIITNNNLVYNLNIKVYNSNEVVVSADPVTGTINNNSNIEIE